jgi:hypothetical protein
MTDYQKKIRPDMAILDALTHCTLPVNITVLHELVCPREQWVSLEALGFLLLSLEAEGLLTRMIDANDPPVYHDTCKGRAHLCAFDAQAVFGERVDNKHAAAAAPRPEPIQVSVCNAEERKLPSTALICLDEDELDDWWASLDVECKADAFAQFALHMHEGHDSHVYVEPSHLSVPVTRTLGALPTTCCYCGLPGRDCLVERKRSVGTVLILRRYTCASHVCNMRFEAEADATEREMRAAEPAVQQ